jgi:quercetin dioxygenase-like cupin family protein
MEEPIMDIFSAEKMAARRGEEANFTGTVWLNELSSTFPKLPGVQESSGMRANLVFFEPGARTAWHTHAGGQILYVVAGNGRIQRESQSADQEQQGEMHTGDVIYIVPNEKHWHGAAPNSSMTHLALNLGTPSSKTNWMEKVTDTDYNKGFNTIQ